MESQEAYFQRLFKLAKGNEMENKVGGKGAVVFLQKSGIDRKHLRTIWELADAKKNHFLDFNDFCVAMKYVGWYKWTVTQIGLLQETSVFPSPTFNGIKPQATDADHFHHPTVSVKRIKLI